ncbi:phosphatase PAP2 family protein, partial [Salmonella enterica]|nr:phosphatase PAP2 family protein [Salmonella enterica]
SLFGISAILGAGLIVNILKYFVGRPRPFLIDSAGPFGFKPFDFSHAYVSFPSGHACTAAVLATLLALWFPRYRFF